MKKLFANNASALLATSIGPADTNIQVDAGFGANYPLPGSGEYFVITLENQLGDIEICHCTARATDLLTVERGQEGTSAISWTAGLTRVECRLTAGTLEQFVQRTGDQMSGNLNMATNQVQNGRLTGTTVVVGGQTVGTAIRGAEDDPSNELAVPGDGSRATAGGSPIATVGEFNSLLPINTIVMWYGSPANVPAGWQICDGTNGTPDLRNRFPLGASAERGLGTTGGVVVASGGGPATADVNAGGSHTHTTNPTVLTVAQLPQHQHMSGVFVRFTSSGDMFGQTPPYGQEIRNGVNIWQNHQFRNNNTTAEPYTSNQGNNEGHSHTISSSGSHAHTINRTALEPGNVAVHFIMKLANFAP